LYTLSGLQKRPGVVLLLNLGEGPSDKKIVVGLDNYADLCSLRSLTTRVSICLKPSFLFSLTRERPPVKMLVEFLGDFESCSIPHSHLEQILPPYSDLCLVSSLQERTKNRLVMLASKEALTILASDPSTSVSTKCCMSHAVNLTPEILDILLKDQSGQVRQVSERSPLLSRTRKVRRQ